MKSKNKVKLKKVVSLQRQDTAVGFYRCIQPMRFLKRQGISEETRILPWTGDLDLKVQQLQWQDRLYMEMAKGSSVIMTDMIWKDEDFLKILNLRKWSGAKWVIDLDDNILAVTRDNPAFTGVKEVLPNMQRSLNFADGVTVSVPSLKNLFQPLNEHIYVNPNGIDFSIFDKLSVKKHQGIRIGWRGASGHKYDLELVVPAMRAITKAIPGAVFVVFTQFDPKFDFPYIWQPFVPFRGKEDPNDYNEYEKGTSYYDVLAKLNLDIAVVPLVDTSYNRGKSNLAYLEFSALKIPTILSPVENQKDMKAVYANSNHEWYAQLHDLITHPKYRESLGNEAYEFVKRRYNMEKLVHPFADWLNEIPRKDLDIFL